MHGTRDFELPHTGKFFLQAGTKTHLKTTSNLCKENTSTTRYEYS